MIRHCEKQFGRFKHKATAHTFRHFFAISMLANKVPIEMVAKWLGHSSPLITAKHYSHANSDFHEASHDAYMRALGEIKGQAAKPPKKKLVLVKQAG